MLWFRIDKASTTPPSSGTYHNWKAILAEEAKNQCVYCAIHEGSFGGERNFHVEHFKPKSRFKALTNAYANLFYACAICNTFKGNQWPGSPGRTFSRIGFIDPSAVDYATVFTPDEASGSLNAQSAAGRYMLEQLYLNRSQLILERRIVGAERTLLREVARLEATVASWHSAGSPRSASSPIQAAVSAQGEIIRLLVSIRRTVPYAPADIRRPRRGTSRRRAAAKRPRK
jgi:hypothetical protein